MKFMIFTNFETGQEFALNMAFIDEIKPHISGKGTQLWSTKAGVGGYHVKEDFNTIAKKGSYTIIAQPPPKDIKAKIDEYLLHHPREINWADM